MTTRRTDAFSRFSWVPAAIIGLVGLILGLDVWPLLAATLVSFVALLGLDRLWARRRGDAGESEGRPPTRA
jgi:hypothetical protein